MTTFPTEGESRWFHMQTADSPIAWSDAVPGPAAAVGVATVADDVLYLGSRGPLPDPLVYRQALQQFGDALDAFADVRIGFPHELPEGPDRTDPGWEPVLRALLPPMVAAVEDIEARAPDDPLWGRWKRSLRNGLPDIDRLVERDLLHRAVYRWCESWQSARMLQQVLAAGRIPPWPTSTSQGRWTEAQPERWTGSPRMVIPRQDGPPAAAVLDYEAVHWVVGPFDGHTVQVVHTIVDWSHLDFDPKSGTLAYVDAILEPGPTDVHVVIDGEERVTTLDEPHQVRVDGKRVWCLAEDGLYDLSKNRPRKLLAHDGAFLLHAVGPVVWFGNGSRLWSWDGRDLVQHGEEVRRVAVGQGGLVWRSSPPREKTSRTGRASSPPSPATWGFSPLDRVAPQQPTPLAGMVATVCQGEPWFASQDRELGTDALVWWSNGRRRARTFGLHRFTAYHNAQRPLLLPPDSGRDDQALVTVERDHVWVSHEVLPAEAKPHRVWTPDSA
jgi:hypothetical protein